MHNQTGYGGKAHKLSYLKETIVEERCEEKFSTRVEWYEDEDKAQLKNGSRWIKEILLQYHNFTMWDAWWKLRNANVIVYSVKTGAYTIRSEDEAKAREVLDFHNDVGGWRVSKCDDLKLPSDNYLFMKAMIEVEDEYNTDAIVEKIVDKKASND